MSSAALFICNMESARAQQFIERLKQAFISNGQQLQSEIFMLKKTF